MNKSTVIPDEYIDALPLSAERKGELRSALPTESDDAFGQLHHLLAEEGPVETRADDAPQESVKTRVEQSPPGI